MAIVLTCHVFRYDCVDAAQCPSLGRRKSSSRHARLQAVYRLIEPSLALEFLDDLGLETIHHIWPVSLVVCCGSVSGVVREGFRTYPHRCVSLWSWQLQKRSTSSPEQSSMH